MSDEFDERQWQLAKTKLPADKFEHSVRVGLLARRQGPRYAAVGLMHDMVEDSDVTEDELRAAGVTEEELAAVRLLTRGPEPYEAYVGSVVASENRLAISVKLCDLLDHLDPSLVDGLDARKQARYLAALPAMLDALRTIERTK